MDTVVSRKETESLIITVKKKPFFFSGEEKRDSQSDYESKRHIQKY